MAHEVFLVPHSDCRVREPDCVYWPPAVGHELYDRAAAKSMGILKIHSHPAGFDRFSHLDDQSDKELFQSLHSWTDDGLPHASAVMLPDGKMFGRFVGPSGEFHLIDRISVIGDHIRLFDREQNRAIDDAQLRTAQAFGDQTTLLLKRLRVAVVGCSGTGSWVIEQLVRLGVGQLVIVDPDVVERKNLNRIVNSNLSQAERKASKVAALAAALRAHGTGTEITPLEGLLFDEGIAKAVAGCDVVFGCMDKFEGRDRLNRLAVFYLLAYIDLGVRLDADGKGGIDNVCGAVHYLLPDGSSLLSRGCYSSETLRVEALLRTDPAQYKAELDEGYIKGAKVDSPAVISVNGFCASMAVNELLARLHPYRENRLEDERFHSFDLRNCDWTQREEGAACKLLAKKAGRGDMTPFLDCITDV
ncbi:HesA/MoeB/ThiF family protein [Phragmitibacter flavus]|nr:ThiF family adenylyltransferase [Phragmitibacter flavus]